MRGAAKSPWPVPFQARVTPVCKVKCAEPDSESPALSEAPGFESQLQTPLHVERPGTARGVNGWLEGRRRANGKLAARGRVPKPVAPWLMA